MVFSSLEFTFGFLPIVIGLYMVFGRKTRIGNSFLLVASILFYSWGDFEHFYLLLGVIICNWLFVWLADSKACKKTKKISGIIIIICDIICLLWFKYANWIGGLAGINIGSNILPIGISFYTFQAISYVADVLLMGKYSAEKNPINVGLYIAFFPQLIAGPIIRFEEIRKKIYSRHISFDGFEAGCFRFAFGFCKKVLLADSMGVIADKAFAGQGLSFSFAWLGAIAYTFQIYMDFSGYSDMAIGLGGIFGFVLPENFNNPYRAISIRDFWKRWHITLSIWFRDYVYIPLGGNRKSHFRTVLNVLVVWFLTGLWHGANYTFILWGLIYGVLVLIEKWSPIDKFCRNGSVSGRTLYQVFTILTIVFLWVIFRSDNIQSAFDYIQKMFSFNSINIEETILYLTEYKWAIFGCIIASCVSVEAIMRKRTILWPLLLILFVVSISYLVKGTYSPFLYFNF